MYKKSILFLLITIFVNSNSFAQQWDTIGNFNSYINCLKTFNNKLFIGGDFTKNNNNSSNCYWSATYDGTVLSPHTPLIAGSGIEDFEIYNNELYAASGMTFSLVGEGVVKWDGSTWNFANSIQNINYQELFADGNDLYSTTSEKIYKKTGSGAFQLFASLDGGGTISDIIKYQNDLYFCGHFDTIGGVYTENIAKWNGTSWSAVGTGLNSQSFCLSVYNNELYVGGWFTSAGNVSANHLAKWNGTTWSAVGGSVTGTNLNGIRGMKSTTSGLVVVGDFNQIGNVNSNHVAKWNGVNWIPMSLTHNELMISCVEEYNGSIYVGAYDFNLPNKCRLYKYKNTVGLNSIEKDIDIKAYPNPTNSDIVFKWNNDKVLNISIFSSLGQLVKTINVKNLNEIAINLNDYNSGLYYAVFKTENNEFTEQIIKK